MKFLKLCIFFLLLFSSKIPIKAQCDNLNFSQNNFNSWIMSHGTYYSCCPLPGAVSTSCYLINNTFNDTSACNNLTSIPAGNNRVLKLGNEEVYSKADRASYSLLVNENNSLITIKYAVIFQEPHHFYSYQPRFDIRVLNSSGNLIDILCSHYEIVCNDSNPEFNQCVKIYYTVLWKDWAIESIDLSPYIGQTVTLEFTSKDCALGGHFGYAYFTADCGPKPKIEFNQCDDSDSLLTITAPDNFSGYLWNNGQTTQSITVNINNEDSIRVYLTSFLGCQTTIDTIVPNNFIDPNFKWDQFCLNDSSHFYDLSATSHGFINKWFWKFGDGNTSNLQNPIYKYNDFNSHYVNLKVTNNFGCSKNITKYIYGLTVPKPDFTYKPQPTDIFNSNIFFQALNTNQNIINYYWNFADLDSSILQNPSFQFPDTGSYPVTLTITNDLNCKDSITYIIKIDDINTLYIPAAFTPNGDGINDVLKIHGLNIDTYNLIIFNRWGQKIFYSDNINQSWNGEKIPEGIYVYKIEVKFKNQKLKTMIGNITLIR